MSNGKPGFIATARNFLSLANRWGTVGGNPISGIFNQALPVSVIERFRDDVEGALFGITAFTVGFGTVVTGGGRNLEFPACCFASLTNEWEIHRINVTMARPRTTSSTGEWYRDTVVMETPFQPYNPCFNNILGPFLPGLILKRPFVFGTVFGASGTNPVAPTQPAGFTLTDSTVRMTNAVVSADGVRGDLGIYEYDFAGTPFVHGSDFRMVNTMQFDDPPLRVPVNGVVSVQRLFQGVSLTPTITNPFDLSVSILYNEIENRRQ